MSKPSVLWVILVKNGEIVLPLYLKCLLEQTYPKDRIFLYIRTNDNNDDTENVLKRFLEVHSHAFMGVFINCESVDYNLKKFSNHEWNRTRFLIMAQLRQEAMLHALEMNLDFLFSCDVDNFLTPTTLENLVELQVPAVAPMLQMIVPQDEPKSISENKYYSNFHDLIDEKGSYLSSNRYYQIISRAILGIFKVDLIHCTYLIRRDIFTLVNYSFFEGNWEYQNFALSLKECQIPQLIDNRFNYGFLTMSDRVGEAEKALSTLNSQPEDLAKLKKISDNTLYEKRVITVEDFKDRHQNFIEKNGHLGNWQFIFGTNGKELGTDIRFGNSVVPNSLSWKKASIANALNHRNQWLYCIERNQPIVIFEDDVETNYDFDYLLDRVLSQNKIEIDLLHLGYNFDSYLDLNVFESKTLGARVSFDQKNLVKNSSFISRLPNYRNAYKSNMVWGLSSYLITPTGAKKLIQKIPELHENLVSISGGHVRLHPESIDALVNSVIQDIAAYSLFPPISITQNDKKASKIWSD